jgi:exopolysaccharide biosynthesis polyprenyl glycosylphosphotransferase
VAGASSSNKAAASPEPGATVGRGPALRSRARTERLEETRAAIALEPLTSPMWEVIPGVESGLWSAGMEVSNRRDATLRRALALADVTSCVMALCIAIYLLPHSDARPRATDLLLIPLAVVISKAIGLYDREQHCLRKSTLDEIPNIFTFAVLCTLGIWLAESVLLFGALDRPQVLFLIFATFVLTAGARTLARFSVLHTTSAERVLVVGSDKDCEWVANVLAAGGAGLHSAVAGCVELGPWGADPVENDDMPQLTQAIADAIALDAIERVIFAPDGLEQEQVLELIRLIKALGVKLSVLPRLLEVVGSASTFDELQGMSLLGVRPYGLSRSSRQLKRAMDVTVSALALLLLSPLLLLIAMAVKVDSDGPALFRQNRIGRKGQYFKMIKFRSMVAHAEELKEQLRVHNEATGGLFKIAEDPRVTRVGNLLRRTSLDELPQLINVLRGDMSLVGPRPLVQEEDALIEGWRRRRLAVKPGMTGLWQIYGASRIPLHEMVKIDYMYGANWSLWLDLKILLRTIPCVVGRRGR